MRALIKHRNTDWSEIKQLLSFGKLAMDTFNTMDTNIFEEEILSRPVNRYRFVLHWHSNGI